MKAEPISIEYDLGRSGWSRFTLNVGDRKVDVGSFSYCTDALGDLVRAALAMATGAYRAEVGLELEPGEQRLIFQRAYRSSSLGGSCQLSLLEFEDFACLPEERGRVLFKATVETEAIARAIAGTAQALWDRHGPDEYNALWMGDRGFPLSALRALQCALEVEDPAPHESAPDDFVFTTGLEPRETDD